jgi:hypothetical protein
MKEQTKIGVLAIACRVFSRYWRTSGPAFGQRVRAVGYLPEAAVTEVDCW